MFAQAVHISFDKVSIETMIRESPNPIMLGACAVGNVLAWAHRLSPGRLKGGTEATSFKTDGVALSVSLLTPKSEAELNAPRPSKKRRHGNKQVGSGGERYSEWQRERGKTG